MQVISSPLSEEAFPAWLGMATRRCETSLMPGAMVCAGGLCTEAFRDHSMFVAEIAR